MASKLMWITAVHVFLSWNYASSMSVDHDENEYAADVSSGIQRDTIHSSSQLPVAKDNYYNEPSTGWGFDHMGNPVLIQSPSESSVSANNPSAQYGDRILQTDVPNEPSPVDSSRETKSKCSEKASGDLEGTTTVRKTILKKRKNVRRKYQHGPYVTVSSAHSEKSNDEPNANIDDGIKNNLSIGNVQVPFGVSTDNLDAPVLSSCMQNDGGPSGLNFKSTRTAKCLDDQLLSALKLNKPYDSTPQQVKPTETFEKYDEKLHQILSQPLIGILPPPKMFETIPQPVLPESFYNKQVLQQALPSPFIMHHSIKPIMRPNTFESPVPPQMMNPEAFFHKQSTVEENKRPLFEVNKQQKPEYVPYNVQFEPIKFPSAQYVKPACQSISTPQKEVLTSALPETVLCDDKRKQPLKLLQWTAQNQNTGGNIYQKDAKLENILRDRYKPNNVLPTMTSSPGRPTHFVAPTLTETSFNKKPLQQQWIKDLTSPVQNVNTPVIGSLLQPTPIGTNVPTSPQYVQPSRPLVAVSLSPILTETKVTEPPPQLSPIEEEISIPQLDDHQQQQPITDLSSAPQLITTSVVESKLQSIPTEKDASISLSNEEEKPLIDLPISPDFVAPKPTLIEKEVSISQPYTSTHSFVTHLSVLPKLTKTKTVESTFRPIPVEKEYSTPLPYYGQSSQPLVDSPPSVQLITTTHVTGSITPQQQQQQQQQVPVRKDVLFSTAETAVPYDDGPLKSQVKNRENYNDAYGNHTAIEIQPGYGAGAFRPYFGLSENDRLQARPFEQPDREVLPDRRVPYSEKPVVKPSFARPQFSPSTLAAVPDRSPFSGPTTTAVGEIARHAHQVDHGEPAHEAFPNDTKYTGHWNAAGSAQQRVNPVRSATARVEYVPKNYATNPSSGLSNPSAPYRFGYDEYSSRQRQRYNDNYQRDNGRNRFPAAFPPTRPNADNYYSQTAAAASIITSPPVEQARPVNVYCSPAARHCFSG